MTIYNITNFGTVAGGPGNDTLNLTYNATTNGVWLTGVTPDSGGGYSGVFSGDNLAPDNALWGNAALTHTQILAFADNSSGIDTVFTFAGGETLTLLNYTDIAGLDAVLSVF